VGKGTGLGLATVYAIVQQCQGYIEVASEVGRGTVFDIYLPRTTEVEVPVAPSAVRNESVRGSGTILLVEDEDGLRGLVCGVLRERGYTVLEARHGREALALSRKHRGPIDLLLTDVIMPNMSGLELARRLAGERPPTRVLYMSGYSDSFHESPGACERVLPKPFAVAALEQAVREALEGSVP
jgi:CheY-like chemotaxis protein